MKTQDAPAGLALDLVVAEKVMGWQRGELYWYDPKVTPTPTRYEGVGWTHSNGDHDVPDFDPSEDIAAAWQVMERLLSLGWVASVGCASSVRVWVCTIEGDRKAGTDPGYFEETTASTAPLAICRAALLAVGVTEVPERATS